MSLPIASLMTSSAALHSDQLFHVAGCTHPYPGEELTFHTCLRVQMNQPGRSVTVSLPASVELLSFAPMENPFVRSWGIREEAEELVITWDLVDALSKGDELEFTISTRVKSAEVDHNVTSRAVVRDGAGQELDSETARVWVSTHSSYMVYLPEIYHENDFLNRLLMLFESFWKPIEAQIRQSDVYVDPQMTPPEFLPWIASWIGISWDESLPAERKRALLHSAVELYQARGTRQALIDYLKLYTQGEVDIIEHRAQNFALGVSAPLGRTVALGTHNFPHTFTVLVRIQRAELMRRLGENLANAEKLYRQRLEAIVEVQKPAHTTFDLHLQIID